MKRATKAAGRLSRAVLHIEMALTLLQTLTVFLSYIQMRKTDLARALVLFDRILPHLFFPVLIAVFSVLLIERLQADV